MTELEEIKADRYAAWAVYCAAAVARYGAWVVYEAEAAKADAARDAYFAAQAAYVRATHNTKETT